MTDMVVVDILRNSFITIIKLSLPLMLSALVVGVVVGLLQAVTHIQEMTLTFVPKIIVMFLVFGLTLPFMINVLVDFSQNLFSQIVHSNPVIDDGS